MGPSTERPPRARVQRWPSGLLGMLVLAAGVEWRVDRRASRFITIDATAWARAGALTSRSTDARVVVLGDSLVKHGLAPAVLERRLGGRVVNLSVTGGTAPGHYFQLRRLLRSGARPAALVVDGQTAPSDPLKGIRVLPELLGLADCLELGWTARDARALGALVLARLLPTYRTRLDARSGIVEALAGKPPSVASMLPLFERNWTKNREAYIIPGNSTYQPPPGPRFRFEWTCHPLNAIYAERLLRLAESRGIAVFWLLPPIHPGHQALLDQGGSTGDSGEYVRALRARHPALTVIDGRHAGYPAAAFGDEVHLGRPGAATFSDAVGAIVAAGLRGERPAGWVELPRWRDEVAQEVQAIVALEDIRQTNQAFDRYNAHRQATATAVANDNANDIRRR